MNKKTSNEILDILNKIIINPKPELDFTNNFELLCAVMLSAQTTDKRVNIVTKELFLKYPTSKELMNAKVDDVKKIIHSLGFSNTKAINLIEMSKILESKYNGIVPNTLSELETLPGCGHKTASVVLALGYNIPALPVDTHLYRMAKRLGYIKNNETIKNAEESFKKYIPMDMWIHAHHLFLLFGRYHCKAKLESCNGCSLMSYCKEKNKHLKN